MTKELVTYQIPVVNVRKVEKVVKQANKSAFVIGNEPDSIAATLKKGDVYWEKTEEGFYREMQSITLVIVGTALRTLKASSKSWQVLARLDHRPAGNIVSKNPLLSEVSLGEEWRYMPQTCEDCKKNRRRDATYLIYNSTSGQVRQVGSSCLNSYSKSVQNAAMLTAWIMSLMDIAQDTVERSLSHRGNYIKTHEYVSWAFMTARIDGFYLSRTNARKQKSLSTADSAFSAMINGKQHVPSAEDIKNAQLAIEMVRGWKQSQIRSNEYMHNMYIILNDDYFNSRDKGYVASLVSMWYKKQKQGKDDEQEQEKDDQQEQNSTYIGTIGEKYQFEKMRLVAVIPLMNRWGTVIHKFTDCQGNEVVWYSSSKNLKYLYEDWKDKVFSIKAKIKNHSEYNGIQQTVISRPRFY